jgi:hypothetical protein
MSGQEIVSREIIQLMENLPVTVELRNELA